MAIKFSQFNLRTDSTPTMFLVGYDGNQNIHITVDNLISDIIDGTENTIAMFGPGGHKVIDSMVTQNAGATLLTVAGQLNVDADATFDTSITVTGASTLNGNVILGNESADLITQTGTLYLNGPVKDTTDALGDADQILVSDASGELTFTDLADIVIGSAEVVEVPVKNLQGSALTKGDPVYISGSVGTSGRLEVKLADASNEAKMPALGLLKQDLGINEEGFAVVTGKLRNLVTDPIDGQPSSPNDVIYVKAGGTTGAALTLTKPTGSNLIQNMGKVGRASTSNDGTFVVSSILRTNDIPNLTPGKIWVGSTGNTIESSIVHLDESTGQMGIGTIDPDTKLDVAGRAVIGTGNTLTGATVATVIGNSNNLTSDSIVDSHTNLVLGDYGAGRYANTVISDRALRLGRADDIGPTALNTTGFINFNDSVEGNNAFVNIGGLIGYFPPPTATNPYYFINAFSENVSDSVFGAGLSPTASRVNFAADPNLNCMGQKFDANTTNAGAVYITASNNSPTSSSRGVITFDVRHQNQNYSVPNGHKIFEITSGYGQTKFEITQASGGGTANGAAALNFGKGNSSTGQGSVAMGENLTASGNHSFAAGLNNSVGSTHAAVFGQGNTVTTSSFNSFVAGTLNNTNLKIKSIVLGEGLWSWDQNAITLGRFNAIPTESSIFVLGNGTTRGVEVNAIEVTKVDSHIVLPVLQSNASYADDTAAAAGGVPVGGLYRNGNVVQIRLT